jgi:hypothetical protein
MVSNALKTNRAEAVGGAAETTPVEWPFAEGAALDGLLADPGEDVVTLALADLVQDSNGEIVLFNDSNLRRLALVTSATELARGKAPHHVTAAGEDVTGFAYVTFDNGVTLYYEPQLELLVHPERG